MPFKEEKQSRFREASAEGQAKASEQLGEVAKDIGKKAYATAYGAGTGLLGSAGEIEEFLTTPGTPDSPKLLGPGSAFGTTRDVQKQAQKIGVPTPGEEESAYVTGGEIAGGLAAGGPGVFKTGVKSLLGVPSRTSEQMARSAEKIGFKLSPAQVRQDVPITAKGATGASEANQSLANKLASEGTGKQATEITSEFISNRLKDLGKDYDKLYKGKSFVVDGEARSALENILLKESELGYAGVSPVKQTAQTMIEKLDVKAAVDGEDLQRLRNALTERARSSTSRSDAHEIYNLVDIIDASVAKNNPALAATLDVLRPKYRNSIILEDLYRQGGIQQGNISLEQLGTMLRGKRDAVRRTGADIDDLGELGRELKLRARWQTEGGTGTPSSDILKKALGTTMGGIASMTGLRSATARKAQKALAREPMTYKEKAGMAAGAGSVMSPFSTSVEE